jgi:hypothetical protein
MPKTTKKPTQLKANTSNSQALTPKLFVAPQGASTLERVIHCIEPYTQVRPIKPEYHVGALVPDLDFLGADLNIEFDLKGHQQYWKSEIDGAWSVQYLADYTDLKKKEQP